ncbi:MAG: sporulation protein YqfD [Clostridia bacterium]|nr:sporulation protein YqfD [Clostridia bacterium]
MFIIELLRFFSGYVRFKGSGGFSERFINLCSVHDIPLWNIAYHGDYFEAYTTINGYRKISICARNSGVKIKRTRSAGIPFVLNRLKPRVGLLFGAIFFVVCLAFLSNKVWVVEISGNKTVPDDIILTAAVDAGLNFGEKTDKINAVQLSLNTCKKIDKLGWAAIRVNGCCVYIDVTEAEPAPEIENREGIYNLVASKDAQLVILECYRGTTQAKRFSSVLKGDILISGTADNKDETTSLVHASGYAVGRTVTAIEETTDTTINTTDFNIIKRIFRLNFFSIHIPIGKAPDKYHQKFISTKNLSFNGRDLPISITCEQYYTKQQKNKTISVKEAKMISMSRFMNSAANFSQGKQIINSSVSFNENQNSATVSGEFICYENIGSEAPLEIELAE